MNSNITRLGGRGKWLINRRKNSQWEKTQGSFFAGGGILVFLDKDFKTAFINIFMDSKEKMYIKKK